MLRAAGIVDKPLSEIWPEVHLAAKLFFCTFFFVFHTAKLSPVSNILKDYDVQHLVEAVSDTVTILLANFRGREVRCDERERLGFVAVLDEPHDRIYWIAIIHDFGRFCAEVVDAEH